MFESCRAQRAFKRIGHSSIGAGFECADARQGEVENAGGAAAG